jgi:16S rRNA (cytidine1402-2'-O)-methyltransferase
LRDADLIFCEDTRKFHDLAQRAGFPVKAKLISLPGDREFETDWERFAADSPTTKWALVSDAGTPIVNDPGAALLRFCRERGVAVEAVPGPSAPVAAWQWSGGFGVPFVFAGFAPKANPGTRELLDFFSPVASCRTFVFFDTRHQLATTLEHLEENGWAEARCFVAREMTKPHEELIAGTVAEISRALRGRLEKDKGVGELTCLIEGRGEARAPGAAIGLEDLARIRQMPAKAASKLAAQMTGRPARECYQAFHSSERGQGEE